MADGGWGRNGSGYPPSAGLLKRPRTEYDLPPGMTSGHDMREYLVRDGDRGSAIVKDTKSIGSAYDRYLQSMQTSSYAAGETSHLPRGSMGSGILRDEPSMMVRPGHHASELAPNGRGVGHGGPLPIDTMTRPVRETLPLPPDASNTLYVEGLPSNCSKREVAHIFRPFVGYKEVRLVVKESKHRGGDPLILCFVDFVDAACAATALSALQGYKMDEWDLDSSNLRIQFSRHPGPRSGHGSRGRH